jgi:hypothetical protein
VSNCKSSERIEHITKRGFPLQDTPPVQRGGKKIRMALEGEDKALARRIIQQFVAKIVIKKGTGTRYYTFPFPDDAYMPSYGNLDLRAKFR